MNDMSFVVFKGAKRLTIKEEDMNVSKIGHVFQINPSSCYLVDDSNCTVFPNADGTFSSFQLTLNGHYAVNGEDMSSTGNELVSSVNTASSSQFSFARNRSTTVSPSRLPTFQRPGKSYLRQIYIGSVQGLNILLDRTVLVKFNTHEANVPDIIAKFSEAVYEEQDDIEDFILTDTKGNQILDTEATRGLGYWKGSARKIVGLTLTDFNSFKNSTLRRTRITDPEDKKRKLEDIEEKLNEIYSAGKKLKSISDGIDTIFRQVSSQTTVRLSGLQSEAVKNSFTCLICKDLLKEPMFAKCCSTIVGCKVCVEEWLRNSTQCHKCRSRGAKDKVFPIVGIDDGLEVLQAIVSE